MGRMHEGGAVVNPIAEHRRAEMEADARLRCVVAATQHFGRMHFGDGDMTTTDMREMEAASRRALAILGLCLLAAIILAAIVAVWMRQ